MGGGWKWVRIMPNGFGISSDEPQGSTNREVLV